MKGRNLTVILIVVAIRLTACGPAPADSPALLGTEWALVSLEGQPPLAGAVPSAAFSADQIEGSAGCNHYSGTYAIAGGDITISDVVRTEMACTEPEGVMVYERAFLDALASAASYRIDGTRFELLDAIGGVILVFEPPSALSSATGTPTAAPPTPTAKPAQAPLPAFEPPAGFVPYQDSVTGISVYIPATWVVTGIVPGEVAILQSYPEDKYVGGEAREPGDTKCDLTIRPEDVSLSDTIEARRTDPTTTIVSEQEVVLRSGEPGTRMEINNMGPAMVLFAEVNERTVVLICFGDFTPFDEIATTLGGTTNPRTNTFGG